MIKPLNVILSDLAPSQRNYYLIRNANALHESRSDVNVQVFTENMSKFCMLPNFSVMNVAEAWAQPGPFIAANISAAAKLIHYPAATRKLFYIWDLEWLRAQNRVYGVFASVYLSPELELVCRSKEHADIVENSYNKEVKHIVSDFNLNKFLEIVG